MIGNDGSWAVLKSTVTSTSISVAVDEDRVGDRERYHTREKLDFLAIDKAGAALDLVP